MDSTYTSLMNGGAGALRDLDDRHAIACVLALAIAESHSGHPSLCECMGLPFDALRRLVTAAFPDSAGLLEDQAPSAEVPVAEDEGALRELLMRFTTNRTPFEFHLAAIVARRSMRSNHLWQDMGLCDRRQLSALLERHFAPLARRNTDNMKWKKFFFRMICKDEGFRLCSAPSCAECDDFSLCFGDESGESLLARSRREAETRPVSPAQTWLQIRPV